MVERWVITFVNDKGMRGLAQPAQGRYTYVTEREAESRLAAILDNASPTTIRQIWGEDPRFKIRKCECHDNHFDPIGVWFEET